MIWLTWRQFRAQSLIAAATAVVAVVLLAITGRAFATMWTDSGAGSCPASGDCGALHTFVSQAQHGWTMTAYVLGTALVYLVPPLVGLFWGAPLVARELETGTQRLIWNQSITRVRWLGTKLAVVGVAAMAFAGLLSLAVTWASHRLDVTGFNRLEPVLFGARGIVPMAYAAFAFVLGVTAGMVIRRAVPAMATTLAAYAAAVAGMALWIRAHLLPATRVVLPLNVDGHIQVGINRNSGDMRIVGDVDVPGAWVIHNQTVTSAGVPFQGPANAQLCGPDAGPAKCNGWIASLGLQQEVVYQPAGHFWPLQWLEAGLFLALTAALVAFGFWWLRRRTA